MIYKIKIKMEEVFRYMLTAARVIYSAKCIVGICPKLEEWKNKLEEWKNKPHEYAEIEKLTTYLRNKSVKVVPDVKE